MRWVSQKHRVADEVGKVTIATVAFPPGAKVGEGLNIQEANCRLLAAAPELLVYLEAAVPTLQKYDPVLAQSALEAIARAK